MNVNIAADPEPESRIRIHIFRRRGLLAAAAVLLASVWMELPGPAVLMGLIVAVGVVARSWSGLSLTRVLVERSFSSLRGFPGDAIQLSLKVENRKPLPLARLELEQRMDRSLAPDRAVSESRTKSKTALLTLATPLLWYRRAAWTRTLVCRRRGAYLLEPVRVSSADIFGLVPRSRSLGRAEEILVYPRIYPLSPSVLPSVHPLGETKARTRIFEDPTRAMGLRRYTPEVPFKHIHWKASAKHGSLQAKVFEPTTSLKTVLMLEADGFEGLAAPSGEVFFELALSLLASLADHLITQGHPAGFMTNAASTRAFGRGSGEVRLGPGGGLDQLTLILESLARLRPQKSRPFPGFLEAIAPDLPWGATLVVVTGRITPPLEARLEDLKKSGFTVIIFQVGRPSLIRGKLRSSLRARRIMEPADYAQVEGP